MNNSCLRIKNVLVILWVLLGISSCGIFKKTSKSSIPPVATIDTAATGNLTNKEQKKLIKTYEDAYKKQLDFKTFSTKSKCKFQGAGRNDDFTAHIRIEKNEKIWVMVTALGGIVQVARIQITPDSFMMLNYLEKTYIAVNAKAADSVLPFPIDFSMMQNLLMGDALFSKGAVQNVIDAPNDVYISLKKENVVQELGVSKTRQLLHTLNLTLTDEKATGKIFYGDYRDYGKKKIPIQRKINISNKGQEYYLEMNYSNVKFDEKLNMPFSIPQNFSKK